MSAPYRVLVAHNTYQQVGGGGEDAVVAAEISMLRRRGHPIEMFSRHNNAVRTRSALTVARQAIWSTESARDFELTLKTFRPNVVHVHNTLAVISPSIYWVAARHGVPVVQTLHNFRLLCPQANLYRNGTICENCLGKLPWRGSVHACYRDSIAQSSVLTGMLMVHRAIGTWQHKVTRYIALNEFCRDKFIEGGLPAEKLLIKPNFVDFPPPQDGPRQGILFVGRLSKLKGICLLADAVKKLSGIRVRVAGIGPDSDVLQNLPDIDRLGSLELPQIQHEMTNAVALVLPSLCYDSFPRTLVEAFACGLPVIASRLGSLPGLVQDGVTGLLFDSGNAEDLAEKIHWANANPDLMAVMGRQARARYEAYYTEESNYHQLMSIYQQAIQSPMSPSHDDAH
jgi:glycosyltransferase involved in cell wall biosynthesis